MSDISLRITDAFKRLRAWLGRPGFFLDLLTTSLLVLAYHADGQPAAGLLQTLAFTLLWGGLILSLAFTVMRSAAYVLSRGAVREQDAPLMNGTFDWLLDLLAWALLCALAWPVTAVVFLVAIFARHTIALAWRQPDKPGSQPHRPDVDPASGIETHRVAMDNLHFQLHADGAVVPSSDYLLCDAGLALREREMVTSDLRLLFFKRQPGGGAQGAIPVDTLLFSVPVLGSHWPGVFKDKPEVDDQPVELTEWPEELPAADAEAGNGESRC